MSKARKVKVAAKGRSKGPSIRRPARKNKPEPRHEKHETKSEPKLEAKPESKAALKPAPGGGNPALARLAAMAADSAGDDEPEIQMRGKPASPPPKGGVKWEDLEDDEDDAPAAAHPPAKKAAEPVLVTASPKAVVADGVDVVARGPSKFSLADIEALKAAIKVKGAANVIDGVNLDELKTDGEGLVPVVAQDRRTGAVLTVGWGNKETLAETMRTKQVRTFDRVRQKVIVAGDTPGHQQRLHKLLMDCDKDAVLLIVDQEGPACTTKDCATCFTEGRTMPVATYLGELDATIAAKAKAKDGSEEAKLVAEPIEALRKLVGAANSLSKTLQTGTGGSKLEIDAATLVQALLIACRSRGVGLERVVTDLYARHVAEQMKKA